MDVTGQVAEVAATPMSTPAMSLSRSHLLTWSTNRAPRGMGGP